MPTIARQTKKITKTIAGYPANTFFLLLGLAALAVLIVWLRLFYRPSQNIPTPTPLPNLPKVSAPQLPSSIVSDLKFNQINVEITQKNGFPKSAFILTTPDQPNLAVLGGKIAQKLSLSPSQNALKQTLWQNSKGTLILNSEKGSLSYFLTSPIKSLSLSPDIPSATSSAQTLLTKIGIDTPKFILQQNEIKELSASGFNFIPEKKSTSSAEVVVLPYSYQLNSFPVVLNQTEFPLIVKVGQTSEVIGFTYSPLPSETTKLREYPLVDFSQISSLLAQSGRLISLEPDDYTKPPYSETISTFSLKSISFSYYYSPTQNTLYPAFLVKGHGTFADQAGANLTFLLSAVNPAYFQ